MAVIFEIEDASWKSILCRKNQCKVTIWACLSPYGLQLGMVTVICILKCIFDICIFDIFLQKAVNE